MVTEPGPGAVPPRSRQGAAGRRVAELGTNPGVPPAAGNPLLSRPQPSRVHREGTRWGWGSLHPESEAGRGRRWEEAPPGGSLGRAADPRLPRTRPINEPGHGGRWRRGRVARGRGAGVATLPGCKSPGRGVARDPRPGRTRGPAPDLSGRQVAASARGSELLRLLPAPTLQLRTRGSALALPAPECSLLLHRAHSEVRLLRSFHVFLCLSFPACDCLQLHAPGNTASSRLSTAAGPPPIEGPERRAGSWQRFRGFEGLRGDQGPGVEGDCRGRGRAALSSRSRPELGRVGPRVTAAPAPQYSHAGESGSQLVLGD